MKRSHMLVVPSLLCSLALLSACAGVPGNDSVASVEEDAIDPAEHLRAGDRAAGRGELELALAQYALAVEGGVESAELYYKVALVHQARGRADLAERGFRQTLASSPEHVPAHVALGLLALRRGDYRYAEIALEEALEHDPRNGRALNALGVLNDLEEDFVTAGKFYDRALETMPNSADVLNNAGYSLYLQGRMQAAKRRFEEVIDVDPEHAHGWSNLALVHLQLGNETMAEMAFRNVIAEHQALNNIGYFDLLRENERSAREKFIEAARLAPSHYELAYRNLASLDARESEHDEDDVSAAVSSGDRPVQK